MSNGSESEYSRRRRLIGNDTHIQACFVSEVALFICSKVYKSICHISEENEHHWKGGSMNDCTERSDEDQKIVLSSSVPILK